MLKRLTTQDNVLFLADAILNIPMKMFDMNGTELPNATCGTAGCIAGHAMALWPEVYKRHEETTFDQNIGLIEKLGLTQEQANRLFYPADYDEEYFDTEDCVSHCEVTRAGAAATLRRFAETGEIVWRYDEQIEPATKD